MRKYKVEPLISFENIPFGTERLSVRKSIFETLGLKHSEFLKGNGDNSTDAYDNFHIFYDEFNRFEAVEFFGDSTVFIDENLVFPNHIDAICQIFPELIEDMGSWISIKNSVGIYAPQNVIESIMFGKDGYYGLI
jgi:hypothetical protein